MAPAIKIKGLCAIGAATVVLWMAVFLFTKRVSPGITGIIVVVGLQSMAAFWALLWALPRSNSAFFSIFAGDALLRLAGLGGLTYWLGSRHLPYAGPLLTLAFSYLVLSLVQIPFFYKVR